MSYKQNLCYRDARGDELKSVLIGATMKKIKLLKVFPYIFYGEAIYLHGFEINELLVKVRTRSKMSLNDKSSEYQNSLN